MVVNSPQQGLISWERWHWGGTPEIPMIQRLPPSEERKTIRADFGSLPSLPSRGTNFYRPFRQLGFKKLSKRFLSFWKFIRQKKPTLSNGNWKGSRLFNSWSWIMFDHFWYPLELVTYNNHPEKVTRWIGTASWFWRWWMLVVQCLNHFHIELVGGFNPSEKIVKMGICPK